jgi:hypothetical protein
MYWYYRLQTTDYSDGTESMWCQKSTDVQLVPSTTQNSTLTVADDHRRQDHHTSTLAEES